MSILDIIKEWYIYLFKPDIDMNQYRGASFEKIVEEVILSDFEILKKTPKNREGSAIDRIVDFFAKRKIGDKTVYAFFESKNRLGKYKYNLKFDENTRIRLLKDKKQYYRYKYLQDRFKIPLFIILSVGHPRTTPYLFLIPLNRIKSISMTLKELSNYRIKSKRDFLSKIKKYYLEIHKNNGKVNVKKILDELENLSIKEIDKYCKKQINKELKSKKRHSKKK